MRPKLTAAAWMGAAFAAALCLAAAVLAILGAGVHGTNVALFATGRLSFLLFWPAYAGGAMAVLFGPAFQPLRRNGREFGLAFASAHLVHMGLVARLCTIGATPALGTFVFFGVAAVWTYVLAALSLPGLRARLDDRSWWWLRTIGLNYIAFAFARDFVKLPFGGPKHMVEYVPFAALAIAGPVVRLAAFVARIGQTRRARA
jgi:hypothetical protein